MILYSEIAPGAWLRQKDVAAQFEVSRTPVREAFRTLAHEGLVELVPNYGVKVTPLSLEEFEELCALRSGIEGLAARLTAEKLSPEAIPPLRHNLEVLSVLIQQADLPLYIQAEWQFRVQCYQTTGRTRLLQRVRFLREHSERYTRLAYPGATKVEESFDFHVKLLAAFEANDGPLAESTLQAALRWTLTNAGPTVAASVAKL